MNSFHCGHFYCYSKSNERSTSKCNISLVAWMIMPKFYNMWRLIPSYCLLFATQTSTNRFPLCICVYLTSPTLRSDDSNNFKTLWVSDSGLPRRSYFKIIPELFVAIQAQHFCSSNLFDTVALLLQAFSRRPLRRQSFKGLSYHDYWCYVGDNVVIAYNFGIWL